MTAGDWGLLVALSVVWGGSFFFQGVAVRELPTLTIVVCRLLGAAAVLAVVMAAFRVPMPTRPGVWAAFAMMGLLNNALPFSLIVWGQGHIGSGLASILNAMTPIFTVIAAHALTADEKLTGPKTLGVGLGFIGVAVMIGGEALDGLGTTVWAQLAVLAATVSYGLAGIFGRRFRAMGMAPLATATGQVTASGLMLTPAMLVAERPWTLPMPGGETLAALGGLAVASTALAYVLYFRILARAGATNVLLVTFLVPVSATALGILVLGEALMTRHLIGMALIGAGLAAIDGRALRAATRR